MSPWEVFKVAFMCTLGFMAAVVLFSMVVATLTAF